MGLFFRSLFALSLLSVCTVLGAVPARIMPSQSHDIWDRGAGFPGGYVYSMTQTGDGYLWIGTSKGLVRYDGLTFLSVRESDSSPEIKFPIVGLATDSSDQLWATDDRAHVFKYIAGRLVGPLPDNGTHQHQTNPVNITRDGWLLFAGETQGLVEYERGVRRVLLDASAMPNSPTAVAQGADGTFWIGTRDKGLFRVDIKRGPPEVQRVTGVPYTKINCLLPIGSSTLLVGTDKGLLSVQKNRLVGEADHELSSLEILALASGRGGNVWIGTDDRLFKADAKDIDTDGTIDSLEDMAVGVAVTSLLEARVGNLWIGGPEAIERYRIKGFSSYWSSAGLPCSNCGSIYVDDKETVWFAPWGGGLFRLVHGWIQPILAAGLKDDTVYSIVGDGDDVWVGRKNGGVTRLRAQGNALQTSTYTRQNGLAENAVSSVYRAPDGTVWAGTLNGGLSRLRAGTWHTFTTHDGLPSNTISVIAGNAAGELFAGTSNGLAELRNNRWVAYSARDGLPPGPIESLSFDDTGTLWIGTAKGISFLRSGAVHVPVNAPEALYGEILGIAENKGWLWISTNNHVLRVKCSALLNDSFGAGDYREFGVTDGLPSLEGVKRSRSVVKDKRGRIWFSLNQGIAFLQPSTFAQASFPVAIRLDGMLVDGKFITPGGDVRVAANGRRLTFRYAGVNISHPETVRYRYRLDNIDSAWSEPTALREVDYTHIPPGQYRFEVMARDADGRWSGQAATMTFSIAPAYYQTTWFLALCGAALFTLIWAIYQLRVRALQRRQRVLERHQCEINALNERLMKAQEEERMRIAGELHDGVLQQLTSLTLRLGAVKQQIPLHSEAKANVRELQQELIQMGKEIRHLSHELHPAVLQEAGLPAALSAYCEEFSKVRGIPISYEADESVDELSPGAALCIYRIAQEALGNVAKHSRAKHVQVRLSRSNGRVCLLVSDDGVGFSPRRSDKSGGLGLINMRERLRQLNGTFEFDSEPGRGTKVSATVPFRAA
jgi:signal transduction histidine kinase/ligand-binding sensor domain-containing protein